MDAVEKFQTLLEKLFQFDASDLDFGIYRILNFKRNQIGKFIREDLKDTVEKVFAIHKDERLDNIGLQLEDAKQRVIQTLGAAAILATGELKDDFKGTPVGRDYLAIKAQKEEAETIDEIKLQVFNDLYNFFARYYEEGDFVPQYRYSIKNHKYAIPYNGEEVKLYWANCDQYYTKTGILFRDYAFFTDAGKTFKIIFRTVTAKEELGSNKATKARFFVLDGDTPCEMKDGKTLIIRLQYRELNSGEVKKYGVEGGSNTSRQEKINSKIHESVIDEMKDPTLKAFLGGPYKNDKPLLLYQLGRFTAKNTKDYFIHKNLKRFLSEQLDYFIKAEVISLETLEKERFFDKHITRAKVVREIGEKVIDFLSQIEDFQKSLWEKKKFVLKTEYVITTDLVPKELYPEILKNKAQAKEWKELGFEVAKSKPKLKDMKLPIDTKHFPEEFKEGLLERLTESADLDDLLDGLLIKSENWQALNLLQGKYREKVKCIYIDPPYNTGNDEFLYRDRYKDSSWIGMIENRVSLAKNLLNDGGFIFTSIDENEINNLAKVFDIILPHKVGIAVIQTNPKGRGQDRYLATSHDYLFIAAKSEKAEFLGLPKGDEQLSEYNQIDEHGSYRLLELRNTHRQFHRGNRPNLWYPLYVDPGSGSVSCTNQKYFIEVLPIWSDGFEGCWTWGRPLAEKNADLLVGRNVTGKWKIYRKDYANRNGDIATYIPKSIWAEKEMRTDYAQQVLDQTMGNRIFQSPKPTALIQRAMQLTTNHDEYMLDFFAGSGTSAHAVISLNTLEATRRRYVLIEMANHFDSIILSRIKKVVYTLNWEDGKPLNANGISHFLKYQYLEQYEDALDNLELVPDKTAQKLFGDDYLLKYFLDFETKDNPSFLNIEHLKKPFSYKLKVNLEEVGEPQEVVVDIPETFHYLLGLKVNKVKVRKNRGSKYLFTSCEKENRTIAVVWREYDDEWTPTDFKKDKEFIIEELGSWSPQIVYVNGQSVLTPTFGDHVVEIRSIEPEFKALMVNSL